MTASSMILGRTLHSKMQRLSTMTPNRLHADPELLELSNFLKFDDPTLLRAMDVNRLLRARASILRSSSGNGETYSESHETLFIDAFLSHNWTTARWQKFLALAMCFNCNKAILLTLIFTVLVSSLAAASLLPKYEFKARPRPDGGLTSESEMMSIGNRLCLGPVLIVSLLSVHELTWRLGMTGPRVFLDKTCIHQSDEERKAKGIRGLGASILKSKKFIVLYADTYFKKLWTVYEIATFVALHSTDRLTFVPMLLPQTILTGMITSYIGVLLNTFTTMRFVRVEFEFPFWLRHPLMPSLVALAVLSARWGRLQRDMHASLATFDIRHAACFVEDDRAFVEDNVATLVKATGVVEEEASIDEAISAFNHHIRTRLPQLLDQCLGRAGVRYNHLVMMSLPLLTIGLDYSCFLASEGASPLNFMTVAALASTRVFGLAPLIFGLLAQTCKCASSRCQGWKAGIAIAIAVLLAAAGLFCIHMIDRLAPSAVPSKSFSFLIPFGFNTGILLMTWFVFRPRNSETSSDAHEAGMFSSHGKDEGKHGIGLVPSDYSQRNDMRWEVPSEVVIEPPNADNEFRGAASLNPRENLVR